MLCMVLAKSQLEPVIRTIVVCRSSHALAEVETHYGNNSRDKNAPANCASLLQLCRNARALFDAFRAHAAAIEFAFENSNILGSALLHLYAQHGALPDAHQLLWTMEHRDKFTWNHMIKGYGLYGHAYETFLCFDQMQTEGVLPDMFVYASVLSGCATLPSLNKGQQLHSIITSCGITMDVVVGTALVNMYGKCGRLTNALKTFHAMHEHDTTSWNAIIANHAQHEQVQQTVELLKQMQAQGLSPNKVTFISILPAFVNSTGLDYGREVHDLIIKYGFEWDIDLANAMISMYGKCGSMEDGWALFESVSEKNTFSWTVMIQSVVLNGQSSDALTLFKQMQSEGASPDMVTYVNMLCACADQSNLAQGEFLHALIMPSLGQEDVELQNVVLNMYSKCGSVETAKMIFEDMVERSVVSWNAMISACVHHNQNQSAIHLFFRMQTSKYVPDRVTFLSALSACVQEAGAEKSNILGEGMDIHSLIVCYGLETDIVLGNALVLLYGKHRALKDAQGVFDNLVNRNTVSWNVFIAENVKGKRPAQAFSQMVNEGVIPCKGTIVSLLSACDHPCLLKFGKVTHALMATSLRGVDISTANRLIDMYLRCGSIHCAQEHVFNYVFERDQVAWTQMIGGYTNSGQSKIALDLFNHMHQEGLAADRVTYICILSACADDTALAKGKLLHARIAGTLLDRDIAVGNALLNMYGKCGNMKEAQVFFSRMPVVDKVSWSSMIANHAQHGHSKDALQVFKEMQCQKVRPDQVTFVSVLFACSHAGRVAEGCYWFEFMKKDLALSPTLDHYNCMIDLLGRAGMLNQAEDMIRDMHFEPNVVSWMTLLGSCRFHVDVERGERYAEQVFKLNPLDPAPYVMLSNIYYEAGREEQAARVITQMREKGLGQGEFRSRIEISGKVHEFSDGDCRHPQSEEIHAELQLFSRRLAEVDETFSKMLLSRYASIKHHLLGHSEKIALAFGLISTSPGMRLLISKDSEVCFDCHSFIKLASKYTGREIVLKDARRFHYMQDGACSCRDLW